MTTQLIQMEIARLIKKATGLIDDANQYYNFALSTMNQPMSADDNVYKYIDECYRFQEIIEQGYLESYQSPNTSSGHLEAYIFAHNMLSCASRAFQYAILFLQGCVQKILEEAFNAEAVSKCAASFDILDKMMNRSLADTESEYSNLIHFKNLISANGR